MILGDTRALIVQADNMSPEDGLPSLKAKLIDHVICDPPYSARVHTCSRRGMTGFQETKGKGAQIQRVRDLGFDPLGAEERSEMARQIKRLVRRWVLVFCDHEGSSGWREDLEAAGLEYVRTCVWIKIGCTPQLTGDRPAAGHECIVVAHQTKPDNKPMRKRWNGGGKRGVYEAPIVRSRSASQPRLHTTQKPLGLMLDLVSDFTQPGQLIGDPYAGSGTTGLACAQLGRRFLGWERDEKYAEIATRRLDGLSPVPDTLQTDLFEAP